MHAPLILSLETSTPVLSAALMRRTGTGLQLLATRQAAPPTVVSTRVPGVFQEMLEETGGSLRDVGAVVCGLGPGLFTGARVAVSTMKALAYARQVPLLGAGSLESLALAAARGASMNVGDILEFEAPLESPQLCPVIDARKGEVYFSILRWTAGRCEVSQAPAAARPEVLLSLLENAPDMRPCGAGLQALGKNSIAPLYPAAAETAFLALKRQRDPTYDRTAVLSIEPTYIRPPEAEVARRKRLAVQP